MGDAKPRAGGRPGAFPSPEDRPYRKGWSILPEREGSFEDEAFTDLEAIREALDSVAPRSECASGQVALRYDALYETVEREMDRLRASLSGESPPAEPVAPAGEREDGPERVYLALDTDGFDPCDPLANVFVYRRSYPTVHYDAPSYEEVEISNDAEMEAWLSRNWDLWRRDPTF
jgi:hypothetical protein